MTRRLDRLALGAVLGALVLNGCQPSGNLPGGGIPRRGNTRPTGDWLDGPTAGTDAPTARTDKGRPKPTDAGFDAVKESGRALGGVVEDPDGKPARGVSVEYSLADGGDGPGAPLDTLTDNQGRFQIYGLKAKSGYVLTARSRIDGRDCAGRVYVPTGHAKSQQQVIALNYDFLFPTINPSGGGETPRRPNFPGSPRSAAPPDTSIPPPSAVLNPSNPGAPSPVALGQSSLPARAGELGTPRAASEVGERDWSPTTAPPAPTPTVGRPELRTEGPTGLTRPPAASIPGSSSRSVPIRPRSEFVLLDAAGVEREFPTGRENSLVLLDFMTTTCGPCKRAVPALMDVQTRYGPRGLEVVGVLCDDAPRATRLARAAEYKQAHGLNYVLYTEPGPKPGTLLERYDVTSFPTVVLVNGEGDLLWKGHPTREAAALERVIAKAQGR